MQQPIRKCVDRQSISQAIIEEAQQKAAKIDTIEYGKIIFVIHGGRVVRVVTENAWLAGEKPETE